MVPKVASSGHSFKGAAAYYLHDKKASTSERVAFIEAVNLPTNDDRRAIAHMIDTAEHASQLKAAAGLKAGRKLQKPVYAYSLSWHPDQSPTKAEQIEAARQSLKALGVADRQALIVAHTDEPHPHVHVIVNRVCPETGKAAKMDNDHLRLSQWAERYERENGGILCAARVENNDKRKREFVKGQSLTRKQHYEWKKAQTAALWDEHRTETANLRPDRKAQFEALWQQKDERFQSRRAEIKELWKPTWREVFKEQRQQLRDYDRRLLVRLGHARRLQGSSIVNMFRAMVNDKAQRQAFIDGQTAERQQIAARQGQAIRDAGKEITKAWRYDRDLLRAAHNAENQERYEKTQAKTKEVWQQPYRQQETKSQETAKDFAAAKDRRQPENRSRRNTLESFFGGDQEAIDKAREQQEKRRERNRERKRERGRDRDGGGRTRGP